MNRIGLLALALALAALAGCSQPPAVEFENLHLIASLRTACSAKSDQWLSGVERAVNERHKEGQMSAVEKAHFDELIAIARRGDWQAAEKQCLAFEEAQLNRTRSRPAQPHDHNHDHEHHHHDHSGEHAHRGEGVHVAER